MAATCPRPRSALPGPGACVARSSSAAASSASWSATGLRWGGRPSRSPAGCGGQQPSTGSATSSSTAGSTARSAGASASIATWRGPSHAGNASQSRPQGTGDPQPHADPLAPGQGQLPHRVRPLGGRSDALSPAARRLAHPAGTPDPDHPGRSARQQAGRTDHGPDRRQARGPAQARPAVGHVRQRRRVGQTRAPTRRARHADLLLRSAQPRQRGGIENANGVLRRDVPRHATLSGYRDRDLDALLWTFNTTPRKCLAFQTPLEAFARQLGVALEI